MCSARGCRGSPSSTSPAGTGTGPSVCGVPSPLSCGVPCGGEPRACGNTPLPLARSHPPGGWGGLVRPGEARGVRLAAQLSAGLPPPGLACVRGTQSGAGGLALGCRGLRVHVRIFLFSIQCETRAPGPWTVLALGCSVPLRLCSPVPVASPLHTCWSPDPGHVPLSCKPGAS